MTASERRVREDTKAATESELRESEARLELALLTADMGLFEVDLPTGTCSISANWSGRLGYQTFNNRIEFWLNLIHPDDFAQNEADRQALINGTAETICNEHRTLRADGTYVWLLMRARAADYDEDGRPNRLIATMIDITERKNAELRLSYLVGHDSLTGLPNRHLFSITLDSLITEHSEMGFGKAILVCDLDRFKLVNDTRGHVVGDQLLCVAGSRIREAIRPNDFVARLGGDEFAIILFDVDESTVAEVCRRIILSINKPISLDNGILHLGTSVGGAMLSDGAVGAGEVFKRADIALYEAKKDGRNTYRMYESSTHNRVQKRGLLAIDMKEAIRLGQFRMLYQPVVNVRTGQIESLEALMRWHHPARGLISPVEFIPIAEETGMIVPLGEWALHEACKEAATWPSEIRVAVNVSTGQFSHELERVVLSAIVDANIPANRLKLEITESALIRDAEAASVMLHRLRRLGVRIALDDFGTGYSSLSYLRSFPFNKIKIDRSFIRDIAEPDVSAIVRAIVSIGERLGMGIVAEGVESDVQLQKVCAEGCEEVQGFLFSRPIDADEVRKLLGGSLPWVHKLLI